MPGAWPRASGASHGRSGRWTQDVGLGSEGRACAAKVKGRASLEPARCRAGRAGASEES